MNATATDFATGYQAALRDLDAQLTEGGIDAALEYLRNNLAPAPAPKAPRKTSASAVSRYLHNHCEIITLPDFRREGYRVTGGRGTGRVTIYCNFDSEFVSRTRAADLAEQLRDGGFEVEVNDMNEGILKVTGRR